MIFGKIWKKLKKIHFFYLIFLNDFTIG